MKARLPQGYGGGGPSNMQGMLKQAQKMQEDMAKVQEEIEATEYSATVGGGAIEVKANGKKEILSLKIKPEVIDPDDAEMLEDLVISAVNEVLRNVETDSDTRIAAVTGGKLPFGI